MTLDRAEERAKLLAHEIAKAVQHDRGPSSGWDQVFEEEITVGIAFALRREREEVREKLAEIEERIGADHEGCSGDDGCSVYSDILDELHALLDADGGREKGKP